MPDERGGSWPVTAEKSGAVGAQPNALRRLSIPKQALWDAYGTPWRAAARVVIQGGNGAGAATALATASGYADAGDAQAAAVEREVGNDLICVVEEVVIRPVSELGNVYLSAVLTDGGHADDTNPQSARRGDVLGLDIPLPVDGSGVVPVNFQSAGGTLVRLWIKNADPVAPHAVDVEMRGTVYQAAQFRATAPGKGSR